MSKGRLFFWYSISILLIVAAAQSRIIHFSTSGCEITGIRADRVLNDGSYQKMTYEPFEGTVDVPEDAEVHTQYLLPWSMELDDTGENLSDVSVWFSTPRTFTVEGETWTVEFGIRHKIILWAPDANSFGIPESAGAIRHTIHLDALKSLDVLIPPSTTLTVGLTAGNAKNPTYRKVDGKYPIGFRIRNRVAGPVLISPKDNASSLHFLNSPDCFWHPIPQVLSYQVQVAADPAFVNILATGLSWSSSSSIPFSNTSKGPSIAAGTSSYFYAAAIYPRYYWRVRAASMTNDKGSEMTGYGDWSQVWSFTSALDSPVENVPLLISPIETAQGVSVESGAYFSWSSVKGAKSYLFCIEKVINEQGERKIIGQTSSTIEATYLHYFNHDPTCWSPGAKYFWKVRVNEFDPDVYTGDCKWSEERSFTTSPVTRLKLAFDTLPGNVATGSIITPPVKVMVQDFFGNLIPTATIPITIAIGSNPNRGTVSGTITMNAINGVATFYDLSIDKTSGESSYSLIAKADGLVDAQSSQFKVFDPPPVGQ